MSVVTLISFPSCSSFHLRCEGCSTGTITPGMPATAPAPVPQGLEANTKAKQKQQQRDLHRPHHDDARVAGPCGDGRCACAWACNGFGFGCAWYSIFVLDVGHNACIQEDHSQRAWDIMMWARTHDLFRIYRHAMDAQGLVPDRHYSIHVCLPCAAGVCACVWFVSVELASSGTLYVH